MTPKPPTGRQLAYLRALADRTGQTFTYPRTSIQASRQIQRLQDVPSSTRLERLLECYDDPCEIEAAQAAVDALGLESIEAGNER